MIHKTYYLRFFIYFIFIFFIFRHL